MFEKSGKKIIDIKKYFWNKWWERLAVVLFVVILLSFIVGKLYSAAYKDKVFAGVMVGSFPVGGLASLEVKQTIQSQLDVLRQNGLVFVFRDRTVSVPMVVAATEDPDLSYELIRYDVDDIIAQAVSYGRAGNIIEQWSQRILALVGMHVIKPDFMWREDSIQGLLRENLAALEHSASDARLVIQNYTPKIVPEKSGIIFDYDRALGEALSQLDNLVFSPIPLKLKRDEPTILEEEAQELLGDVEASLYAKGATVRYEDMAFYWPASVINSLIEIRRSLSGSHDLEIGISKSMLKDLIAPVESNINIEPQEPRFALEDGKVVEFKVSLKGRKLVFDQTWKQWEENLLSDKADVLEPVVEEAEPNQDISDLNDLGIKELLGVGSSNFGGSPKNRRHNIRVGAEAVNGTLIPPGEEFSLLKTIGKVDASTGYLTELVIKGNETIPEYGGGLCQIGTTTFRATLASGLPITMRRPHSYTVSYYFDEKGRPGKDATIYDPAPDFRFINDTTKHILITTRIDGDDLFFEYWGTNDGRIIEQTDVKVWGRVPPPETKYIETLSLAVGETRCTETPHSGMKAAFDYVVTYPDGQKKEETFLSHYQPWQEVCLVGVEKLSEEVNKESLDIEKIGEDELAN